MPHVAQKRPKRERARPAPATRPLPLDNGWAVRRSAGAQLLVADSLTAIPWLVHGFSTRTGGHSDLAGARALNLGFTDWDSREAVTSNRSKLMRALDVAQSPAILLRQIHSDVAHVFSAPPA